MRRARPVQVTDAGVSHLRLARQVAALVAQTRVDAEQSPTAPLSLAVNADSLDTWVLPALASVDLPVTFDLRREDQSATADLLRDGSVMAAITSDAAAVQGCRSVPLGAMRYRPMASPGVVQRWFPDGVDAAALSAAPVVVFDRADDLQDTYLRATSPSADPPRHHVPATRAFVDALVLGLGWGVLPDPQADEHLAAGRLVLLDDTAHVDVELHWQQWALRTPALDAVAEAVRRAAERCLTRCARQDSNLRPRD